MPDIANGRGNPPAEVRNRGFFALSQYPQIEAVHGDIDKAVIPAKAGIQEARGQGSDPSTGRA